MLKLASVAALAALAALGGCATTPEYKMVPTGEHNVGVRFARGNALMVSNGRNGAVVLVPRRYNSTNKMTFLIGAYNLSGQPINFGTEDVRIRLDDGEFIPVQDFDYLRLEAKRDAQKALKVALANAIVDGVLAYQDNEHHPNRVGVAYRRASGSYYASEAEIQARLVDAIRRAGSEVLQTTTIDPGAVHGGGIVTRQLTVPQGVVRTMDVEVWFGGENHAFRIAVAPTGTASPVRSGIPAVTRRDVAAIKGAPDTYMWDEPDSPSR